MNAPHDEGNPLLAKTAEAEEAAPAAPARRRAALVTAAVIAACVGAAAVTSKDTKSLRATPAKSELATVGYQKDASEILIYKRTCPTKNPAEDCEWLAANLGIACEYAEMTLTGEDAKHDDWCGSRAEAMAGNFNVHHIKDMFEPVGDVEKWVNRFNDAHEGTFSDGDTWDAFMSLGMGYFTPYLKDHLVRWVKNDLPHRAHYYKNTVDGSTMYVITTYNPNTGNVLEIHGTAVSDDDDENTEMIAKHFTKTPSGACELALCLGLSTDHLQQAWDDDSFNHYYTAGHGLPFASVAKISHPTNAADDVVTWMTNNAQLDFTVAESDSGLCRIAHKSIKKYKDTGYAHVMFVEDTRSSAADDEDVKLRAQFLTHVQSVHDKRLGTQRGWDRWLDSHLGFMYMGVHLDDIAPTLVQNGVGFKAYRDVYKMDSTCEASPNSAYCGSLWCGGHSGLGVEFHSFFDEDRQFFNGDFAPTYMDFCDALTNKGNTDFFTDDGAMDDWR